MGYVRCWTAEHHGSPGFAGCAPEILAAVVLGRTRRIRVGTGGVLLPRYSPAKAAEVFWVPASVSPAGWTWAWAAAAVPPMTVPSGCGRCGYCPAWTAPTRSPEARAGWSHPCGPRCGCSVRNALEDRVERLRQHLRRPTLSGPSVTINCRGYGPRSTDPAEAYVGEDRA
ncbi:LLM class flavin-dependent oxidoreductase [Streptomyces sp. NPDC001102]